jgi:23S rRNA maturation-related 3'-5' exoribonuclease YhaM
MNIFNQLDAHNILTKMAKDVGVYDLAQHLLEDERFQTWSGSSNPNAHHYGDYGLIIHTCEVVTTCFVMADFYSQYKIARDELYLAGLFHDAGKIHDYEKVNGVWRAADHKRIIHHIPRSIIIWHDAVSNSEYQYLFEPVTHAILAHHGHREWGSPVAPKSRVAWLLYLCDHLSARLYDADKLDLVEKGK